MLRAKIWIPFIHKNNQQSKPSNEKLEEIKYDKYNLESLHQESVRELFQRRLDSKLVEDPTQTFPVRYKNLIQSIQEAAAESIGRTTKRISNNVWWTEEIEGFLKKKKETYLKWLSSKTVEDRQKYIDVKNLVRNKVKSAKDGIWEKKMFRY